MSSRINISEFDSSKNFDLGRPKIVFIIWYFVKIFMFQTSFPYPSGIKGMILKLFGAKIGKNVYIKPRINIYIPWKFEAGENTLLGEGVEIYNFENVNIGANCCLSQNSFICAANHDYRDKAMCYRHAPITIHDGAWIGACSFVAPGVTVGVDAFVTAGSVVTRDIPDEMICSGNPCVPLKKRWDN
jgi:putative colanic acid biosynthesis acetyltransferase WcaF